MGIPHYRPEVTNAEVSTNTDIDPIYIRRTLIMTHDKFVRQHIKWFIYQHRQILRKRFKIIYTLMSGKRALIIDFNDKTYMDPKI